MQLETQHVHIPKGRKGPRSQLRFGCQQEGKFRSIPGQLICSYHLIFIYSASLIATTVNTMSTTRRLTARPQFEPIIQFRKKQNPWLF